ncbi:hypothetical protein PFLmoz3_04707 [Pseudomonas fluorescens]|uniref:Uncharacterized protein n=1 Tax=Pseudomonas fluorescens TaxID=294 RepID=A0A109LDK8_PSEFL|nr:hypothetical protein PFLmoz3_04707 [Pseudomonas fluorescens]
MPFLIRLPVPATVPARVRALLPPTVNVPLTSTLLARLTTALLSKVVPLAVVNTPLPRALSLPTTSVPPLSAVPPV